MSHVNYIYIYIVSVRNRVEHDKHIKNYESKHLIHLVKSESKINMFDRSSLFSTSNDSNKQNKLCSVELPYYHKHSFMLMSFEMGYTPSVS